MSAIIRNLPRLAEVAMLVNSATGLVFGFFFRNVVSKEVIGPVMAVSFTPENGSKINRNTFLAANLRVAREEWQVTNWDLISEKPNGMPVPRIVVDLPDLDHSQPDLKMAAAVMEAKIK